MSATTISTDRYPTMDNEKSYTIKIEDDILTFRTSSFRAEKSSVLHSGIYSRESSSILLASGICMAAYLLLSSSMGDPALYAALVLLLAVSFMLSRTYIFKEKILEIIFNKTSGTAILIFSGAFTKRTEEIAISNITSLETGSKRFEPENKDGADFVQKISIQHGSAVPGLGEAEEFVTLSLKLNDGSERIIYASNVDEEPELPVLELRKFLAK